MSRQVKVTHTTWVTQTTRTTRTVREDDGESVNYDMVGKSSADRLRMAVRAVRALWREHGPDWAGVAPSHLAMELDCSWEEASVLLMELESAGTVIDSGWGAPLTRPDGRKGTNRFWPVGAHISFRGD